MTRITTLAFSLLMVGCVQVGPKTMPVSECPKLTVPQCPKCPSLSAGNTAQLPAIDETVTIKIRGNQVEADQGGEKLLRYYVYAQKLLQQR